MKPNENIPDEIEQMFAEAPPLTQEDLDEMARENRTIMDSPRFKAGVIKDQFVHTILVALEEEGISQSELARRCGKSRQYLSKLLKQDQRVNFTVDTLVELMHHLGREVEIHYPRIGSIPSRPTKPRKIKRRSVSNLPAPA